MISRRGLSLAFALALALPATRLAAQQIVTTQRCVYIVTFTAGGSPPYPAPFVHPDAFNEFTARTGLAPSDFSPVSLSWFPRHGVVKAKYSRLHFAQLHDVFAEVGTGNEFKIGLLAKAFDKIGGQEFRLAIRATWAAMRPNVQPIPAAKCGSDKTPVELTVERTLLTTRVGE